MAQIDHRLGIPDQLHKYYILLARSGLCTFLLDNSQEQTFLHEGNDVPQGNPGMLWSEWVQTVLWDTAAVMYHLDTHSPQGILNMFHCAKHCKNLLHML